MGESKWILSIEGGNKWFCFFTRWEICILVFWWWQYWSGELYCIHLLLFCHRIGSILCQSLLSFKGILKIWALLALYGRRGSNQVETYTIWQVAHIMPKESFHYLGIRSLGILQWILMSNQTVPEEIIYILLLAKNSLRDFGYWGDIARK